MMISRNLEVFLRVAEEGSVTRVAKMLHISQPAVSNAMTRLEEDLGIRLFFRDKRRGLVLTSAGQKILHLARQMEDLDNRITQTAFRENNLVEGRVRIASLTLLVSTILSRVLHAYQTKYPGVSIEIKEGTPGDIIRMVEDHAVDFALSCSPFGKFDSLVLAHDRMVAMLPKHSRDIAEIDLARLPGVTIINRPAFETILDFVREPVSLEHILTVEMAETAINMVLDGTGIGIFSAYTMDALAPGHVQCPLKQNIAFDIGILAHDLTELTPASQEFARMIKARFGLL